MSNPYAAPSAAGADTNAIPEAWGDPAVFRVQHAKTERRLRALAVVMEWVGAGTLFGSVWWGLLIAGLPVLLPSESVGVEVTVVLLSFAVFGLLVGAATFLGGFMLERRMRGAIVAGLAGLVALCCVAPVGFGFGMFGFVLLLSRSGRTVLSRPYRLVEEHRRDLAPGGIALHIPAAVFVLCEGVIGLIGAKWMGLW
jgi:hypothetical protein